MFAQRIIRLLFPLALVGCQSFSSTMLNRLDNNSFVGNSNGGVRCLGAARPYKGVPITLMVPTHLDVYIDEVYYLQGTRTEDGRSFAQISERLDGTRILDVRTSVVKTKKVFTVDYKRPMSGSLMSNTTFSDEQYFKTITNSVDDTTITDTAALLNTVLKAIPTAAGPTEKQRAEMGDLLRDSRVVAYQRFDLNDPDFELQVEAFVNHHLNNCDQCDHRPTYDTN